MSRKSTPQTVARLMQTIVEARYGYNPPYNRCLNLVVGDLRRDGETNDVWAERLVRTNKFDPKDA